MSLSKSSVALVILAGLPAYAQATVWKCMGEDGRSQYTNIQSDTKARNCTVVSREVSVVPGNRVPAPRGGSTETSSGNFPKVDRETQRSRDDSRRKILEEELSTEQGALSEAKSKLSEQEAFREGGEKNYQRVLDRLQPYKEAVAQHEKNVQALQKEIDGLK